MHTLFSGPAAGAQASAYLAKDDAKRGLVTLDMGGTSADIAFIEGGAPLEVTEGTDRAPPARRAGARHDLDLGGRRFDCRHRRRAAFLPSGRRAPAPIRAPPAMGAAACARPSRMPTSFAVFSTRIISSAARRSWMRRHRPRALKTEIADPLKMSVLEAAAGIRRIVDMRMADEMRVFAAKRGVDLTAFTLLPFGGAGGVHAAAVADELGMKRILVPPRPGAFSALGLLCTDVVHDYIRSDLKPLAEVTPEHAEGLFAQLEAKARAELAAEHMNPADASLTRELDLRYAGQGYELRTSLEGLYRGPLTRESLLAVRHRFDERHAQVHGHAAKERSVEVVSYRLRLRVSVPKYQPREEAAPQSPRSGEPSSKGMRQVYFDGATPTQATIYERDGLDIGIALHGPAIVEQFDATTVIPHGWTATVDGHRNLILTKGA